jgi:hypothetical protein
MPEPIDLGQFRKNGQVDVKKAVLLGREFRLTLDKEHQAVLEFVAKFNGMSPRDYLQHAATWAIRRAHSEIASAIAIQNALNLMSQLSIG